MIAPKLQLPGGPGGGSGTPGGADTQVQFNDGGAFGGNAGLVYNKTTDTLTVGVGAGIVVTHSVKSDASDGLLVEANNGTDVGLLGAGNTANATWYGSHNYDTATQDTIAAFTGAGKTLGSLATATYPSLTELSYVKGVTSAIQTQIDSKTTLAAVDAQKLSVFAATSSAELAGVISDETGTGLLVFNNSPTFVDDITVGGAGVATGTVKISGTTSGTVSIKTADAAGTWTLTLPTNDGDANQVLKTDGSGVTSWVTPSSGGVSLGLVTAISMGYGGTFT